MSERQNLTWAACDALAATGKKPSIGLVREWTLATTGTKKGSDGDVQKDIHQWYDDLLKLKRDKAIADLPPAVSALARDFWRLAIDSANDSLSAERATLAKEKAEAEKLIDLAQEDTAAAVDIANQLKGMLAIAHETIAGRDETIKRLEETLSEARATLAAKDERIAGVTAELARKAEEHAAGLAEREGLRRHTLLQIDQARGEARHWKAEFERVAHENKSTVDTYRRKAATLENDLASARGRLSAIEESLAASRQRNTELEATLAQYRVHDAGSRPASAGKRFGASTLPRANSLRTRKR
jgi:chromosome segregation ATPase